jgi:CHAD domain
VKARKVKKLDPGAPLEANAARIVRTRLDELRSLAPDAMAPDAAEAQHDLRIAAKRLRYVLEATEFCLGKAGQTARRRARDLQDLLGELHDCDVMLPRVQAQIDSLRSADARAVLAYAGDDADDLDPALVGHAPNRSAYRGLELLAAHLQARRALLFERFRRFWKSEADKGTWSKLERAAEKRLRRPTKEPTSPPPKPEPAPPAGVREPSPSAT